MQIVDNAIFVYQSRDLNISDVVQNIQKLTKQTGEIENSKVLFRNIKIDKYEFINLITVSEYRKNTRIAIAFSYSRYENKTNYKLATKQRTIDDVHAAILRIFRAVTGLLITDIDLQVVSLDISNQLEVPNVRGFYNVLALIYRAYKHTNENGRLYFDSDEDARLELDGLDFREAGKKRREASSYFKIYSKRKEVEDTKGKMSARGLKTALRGELTLKGFMLKLYNLNTVNSINKKNLEAVLKRVLARHIIEGINEELKANLDKLKQVFAESKTRRIREQLLTHQHLIFDVEQLDYIFIPEILGVEKRQCQAHKKAGKQLLKTYSECGEIKKNYTDNYDKLKRLLKKIVKADIVVNEGVIEWEE